MRRACDANDLDSSAARRSAQSLSSAGETNGQCNGDARIKLNVWRAANPTALGAPFNAGQVLYAQGWFHDPGAPKQTNLSDGLRLCCVINLQGTTHYPLRSSQ